MTRRAAALPRQLLIGDQCSLVKPNPDLEALLAQASRVFVRSFVRSLVYSVSSSQRIRGSFRSLSTVSDRLNERFTRSRVPREKSMRDYHCAIYFVPFGSVSVTTEISCVNRYASVTNVHLPN